MRLKKVLSKGSYNYFCGTQNISETVFYQLSQPRKKKTSVSPNQNEINSVQFGGMTNSNGEKNDIFEVFYDKSQGKKELDLDTKFIDELSNHIIKSEKDKSEKDALEEDKSKFGNVKKKS